MSKVLVVGAGPSVDYDYIRNFDGTVLCVDRILKNLLQEGIEPDYCLTYEKGLLHSNTNEIDTCFKIMFEGLPPMKKTVIIFSPYSNQDIKDNIIKSGYKNETFESPLMVCISNVGLMAWFYAIEKMNPDHIDLIGLDHLREDFPERKIKCQWFREIFFELKRLYPKAQGVKITFKNEPF